MTGGIRIRQWKSPGDVYSTLVGRFDNWFGDWMFMYECMWPWGDEARNWRKLLNQSLRLCMDSAAQRSGWSAWRMKLSSSRWAVLRNVAQYSQSAHLHYQQDSPYGLQNPLFHGSRTELSGEWIEASPVLGVSFWYYHATCRTYNALRISLPRPIQKVSKVITRTSNQHNEWN